MTLQCLEEKGCSTNVWKCSWGHVNWKSHCRPPKMQQLLCWRHPSRCISYATFSLSKGRDILSISTDILEDAHYVWLFVDHTYRNNFCIGDVPRKSFLVALMCCRRKRTSHRCLRTSSGTSKIYAILLVVQIETTFVLETSLENHFLWHLCAVKGKGRPINVCGHPQGHPKYMPFYWLYK